MHVQLPLPFRPDITDLDCWDIAELFGLDFNVAERLLHSAQDFEQETRRPVQLISGYRTRAEQAALARAGRPAAPDEVSTHRSCPATGADIALGYLPTRVHKAIWGRIVVMNGLRWGGGGAVDDGGIPLDWQHVDAGPRVSS